MNPCDTLFSDALKIGIPSLITIIVLILTNVYSGKRQKLDHLQQNKLLLLGKKEELISALLKYSKGFSQYMMWNLVFLCGVGTRDNLNKEVQKGIPEQQSSEIQIAMLTNIYFPLVLDEWNQLFKIKEKVVEDVIFLLSHEGPPISLEKKKEFLSWKDSITDKIHEIVQSVSRIPIIGLEEPNVRKLLERGFKK